VANSRAGLQEARTSLSVIVNRQLVALARLNFYQLGTTVVLVERVQSPEAEQKYMRDTEASVARATFGSPTFFVGDENFFGKGPTASRGGAICPGDLESHLPGMSPASPRFNRSVRLPVQPQLR
jgi:hypothetical protein